MERIYSQMQRIAYKARIAWQLVKLVAIAIAWLTAAYLVITNAIVLAQIVAIALIAAIAWPMVKAMRTYVAARALLAQLLA